MLILGQVRLSTGELCTAWVKIGKKTPLQIIFNNSRSRNKPGSALDPNVFFFALNEDKHVN